MPGFKVEYQTPRPKVEIIPPDGSHVVLSPFYAGVSRDARHIISNNLLSYAFSEAVDDLTGSFSFSLENEMVIKPTPNNTGKSLFDLIPCRSVVNIYEDDEETPAFRGIIRKRHTGATMTANGVKKSVVFSGESIISCITNFMVPLDVHIPNISNAIAKTKQLQVELSEEDMTIESFMKKTWEYFRKVSEEVSHSSGLVNGRLLQIIDTKDFIGEDFIHVTGKETALQYPVATMFYNQTTNYITEVWRNILPRPAYELFTRFDEEKKKPLIVARQAPYGDPDRGNHDWLDLKLYAIDPASLTGYDLDQSDEDVYTAFNSYVIGSPKAKEFYQVVSEKVDTDIKVNEDKSAMYGFKLLSVSFMGFDRMQNESAERSSELTNALSKLNQRTEYWFSRLDEMYSGTITLITGFKKKKDRNGKDLSGNPRAGCRVSFLGGQFYVEKSEHSWNYGRTPVTRLTVSRGMVYDANGKIKAEIPDMGKLYGELDG